MRFHAPTKIVFGSRSLSELTEIVEEDFKASRPFLVTDQGIMASGIADKISSQVQFADIFSDVEQNPKSATVNKAAETIRTLNPDLIIGLGGGSSMDAAKAIALLATNPGVIEEYEGREKYRNPPLPVLAIPTTCGTGSEVTWVSVITDSNRMFKMSIKGPAMFPQVALVDPGVLLSLPRPLIASTGMDALTHALEAYTATPRTYITDMFALEALQLIFTFLEKAYTDITDEKARENIMLASTLAGLAFGNSDVGAVHCIAESIGGLYDTPHGVANSVFLPFIMEFNLPAVENRYAHIARLTGIKEKDDAKAAQALIEKVKFMSHSLGIPSFKRLGIAESAFSDIAQRSVQNNSNPSNPREITAADYVEILRKAFQS